MTPELTDIDKYGIGAIALASLWILKNIITTILGMLKKTPTEEHQRSDFLANINTQFEHYTETMSRHDSNLTAFENRIKHLENTVIELVKDRRCQYHSEVSNYMTEIRSDVKELKSMSGKIQSLDATLEALREMGAFHSHTGKIQ